MGRGEREDRGLDGYFDQGIIFEVHPQFCTGSQVPYTEKGRRGDTQNLKQVYIRKKREEKLEEEREGKRKNIVNTKITV